MKHKQIFIAFKGQANSKIVPTQCFESATEANDYIKLNPNEFLRLAIIHNDTTSINLLVSQFQIVGFSMNETVVIESDEKAKDIFDILSPYRDEFVIYKLVVKPRQKTLFDNA